VSVLTSSISQPVMSIFELSLSKMLVEVGLRVHDHRKKYMYIFISVWYFTKKNEDLDYQLEMGVGTRAEYAASRYCEVRSPAVLLSCVKTMGVSGYFFTVVGDVLAGHPRLGPWASACSPGRQHARCYICSRGCGVLPLPPV
jgi:hypothetical protein